jgi:hypothetical protein
LIWWLTADEVRKRSSAASRKLSRRAAAQNARNARIDTFRFHVAMHNGCTIRARRSRLYLVEIIE